MRNMMIMLLPALDFEAVVVQLDLRKCFLRSVLLALKSELLAFGCHSSQSLSQSAIQMKSFVSSAKSCHMRNCPSAVHLNHE